VLEGFGRNRELYEAVKKPSGTARGLSHALMYNAKTTEKRTRMASALVKKQNGSRGSQMAYRWMRRNT